MADPRWAFIDYTSTNFGADDNSSHLAFKTWRDTHADMYTKSQMQNPASARATSGIGNELSLK